MIILNSVNDLSSAMLSEAKQVIEKRIREESEKITKAVIADMFGRVKYSMVHDTFDGKDRLTVEMRLISETAETGTDGDDK